MGPHLSLLISATMLFATLLYYYKMVLLTEMTTEASLFNTLYAEYATPQMMDSLRFVGADRCHARSRSCLANLLA
jgi:hypothetical protein